MATPSFSLLDMGTQEEEEYWFSYITHLTPSSQANPPSILATTVKPTTTTQELALYEVARTSFPIPPVTQNVQLSQRLCATTTSQM